jgi:hypothetical protein
VTTIAVFFMKHLRLLVFMAMFIPFIKYANPPSCNPYRQGDCIIGQLFQDYFGTAVAAAVAVAIGAIMKNGDVELLQPVEKAGILVVWATLLVKFWKS